MPGPTVLIVVENNSVPNDIRVWYEATALRDAGWTVNVICPDMGTTSSDSDLSGHRKLGTPEDLEGITLYRFSLAPAENGMSSFLNEYLTAFVAIDRLSWRVWRRVHLDVIHLCNPPHIFFPIALWYRPLGARVVFDHHDLFPETVGTRFGGWRGKIPHCLARIAELLTFRSAHVVISTNESYRQVAIRRGHVREDRVLVVRNGPKLTEFVYTEADRTLKEGFMYMACFVGRMGHEDGGPGAYRRDTPRSAWPEPARYPIVSTWQWANRLLHLISLRPGIRPKMLPST
jgi:glycosyltransferase involved in cell wall biosynthesis